ncbi:hypothetical protein CFP56_024276, partial [Quercus suber]
RNGKYCLVLVFEAKALKFSDFETRQGKLASFFGPGIAAEVGNYFMFKCIKLSENLRSLKSTHCTT